MSRSYRTHIEERRDPQNGFPADEPTAADWAEYGEYLDEQEAKEEAERIVAELEEKAANGTGPQPGTWAFTARLMAMTAPEDEDMDWDAWKDEMKEADLV